MVATALATAPVAPTARTGLPGLAGDDGSIELTARADRAEVELWLTLDAVPTAPARARAAVHASAVGLDDEQLGLLKLLVSELVSNSVVHGAIGRADEIRLLIVVDSNTRCVAVTDHGPGFELPDTPRRNETGGLGLLIVDRVATRWGVTHGGRRVWFEMPRGASRAPDTPQAVTPVPRRRPTIRVPRVAIGIALIAVSALGGVVVSELTGNAGAPQAPISQR